MVAKERVALGHCVVVRVRERNEERSSDDDAMAASEKGG